MKSFVFIFLLSIIDYSTGAKILGVLHFPSRSHYIIGTCLLHGLANKGHDITILSPFKPKRVIPNVKNVYLDNVAEVMEGYRKYHFDTSSFTSKWRLKNCTNHIAEVTLRSNAMKKMLNSGEKYDAIIIEPFGSDALFGLAHVFNSHIIVLSPRGSMILNRLAGNVAPFAFVPSVMTTNSDKMTFIQRVINTFSYVAFNSFNAFFNKPIQRNLYEEYFKNAPDFDDIIRNASLFLVNSNIIFETPRPYLPNMIQVGGMHVQEPKKLQQDIQEFMDNSKEGVILFSFGSVLKSTDIPLEKRNTIIKVLAKLPQNILWKFEDENLPGKPKNVKINKWLPQSDILAHPNVKLFISHGGLLSSTEAIYRGVPILGIPFFADQTFKYCKFCISWIWSKSVVQITEKILRDSEILKDQPMKPLERAIFWVEHIIRHNGGHHLRCASLDLSLVEYLLLDVIAFVAVVLGTYIIGMYLSIKTICSCFKAKIKAENNKKTKRE